MHPVIIVSSFQLKPGAIIENIKVPKFERQQDHQLRKLQVPSYTRLSLYWASQLLLNKVRNDGPS